MARLSRWSLLAPTVLLFVASNSHAQLIDIKRELPSPVAPLCPAVPPVEVSPTADQRNEADRLVARATQLAVVGDQDMVVELLREAEGLNPASPDVAYRLGRAAHEAGNGEEAGLYYCRYLALSPGAEDGDEVRAMVEDVLPPVPPLYDLDAGDRFRDGVAAWDRGLASQSLEAFSDAALLAPRLALAHYNKAVTGAFLDRGEEARRDLDTYLELNPAASDRAIVEEWQGYLVAPAQYRNPAGALAGGLLVPGLGQFMTGSSGSGLALLALGGGAAAVGVAYKTVNIQCLARPDGDVCPDGQILSQSTDRDYLVPGLAAYGGVAIIGAVLAYRRAGKSNQRALAAARFRPRPGGRRGADIQGPAFYAANSRIGIRWFRVSF